MTIRKIVSEVLFARVLTEQQELYLSRLLRQPQLSPSDLLSWHLLRQALETETVRLEVPLLANDWLDESHELR